ncbi:hypothetical protein SSX86_006391 [Deinandra increscens subsp. villosa]|uniref:KIB1-4 beta-propeller domain-containing protein n=1 Tax=Deinandra increscens subsp. villosa TaxID=3103831 RepID=A0AAP0H6R7_9ASTR
MDEHNQRFHIDRNQISYHLEPNPTGKTQVPSPCLFHGFTIQMETKQNSVDHKFPSQWFIAQNLESDTQIAYTIDNMQYSYEYRISELQGRRIRACYHGWMILSNHPDNILWSLWNPLTSKLIHLPPLINEDKHPHECCLSAPPDDQGSFLLLTKAKVPTVVLCRLDCNRKWTEISYDEQLKSIRGEDYSFLEITCSELFSSISGPDECFLERPTCCNGKIYAMTMGGCYMFVIQVDIVVKGEEVGISLMPFVEIPSMSYNLCPAHNNFNSIDRFVKGSGKDLFCIGLCFTYETAIGNVYLFKLDFTSMMWEEMVDLKDAIFFLEVASGYSTCYYDSLVNSEVGGYVHIIGESGKVIYSYHAKDRTMSVSSTPLVVQKSQVSAWAMLESRLEIDLAESKQEEEEDKDTEIVVRGIEGDESEFDITTGESHLLHIPVDVLKMIMELCTGREYMRFRATCKLCYSVAPPILQWRSKTTLRRLQMYSLGSPLLMVFDNYRGIITFIDPTSDDRHFIKIPQELKGNYQIYCSKYGWVLMYEIDGSMVFFNPFTYDIRELPVAPYIESLCFSAPPTSPDCMVVGFTASDEWPMFFHFVSREPVWYKSRLNFGDVPCSYHFPTFNGRDVYALCNNKGLDVFRGMVGGEHTWEVFFDEAARSGCKSPAQYFLSNCDQHSLLVIVGQFGESVEVFIATESSEEWEKIDTLGKHMIYISGTSCICLEAKSPEMGNKIYFPRLLHSDETGIVFYSLETCMYHTFDGKNIQESFGADLFGTKHLCCPHTWIEPCWS